MKVLALKEFRLALLEPSGACQGLTLWTVAVATAVEGDALMLAAFALFNVTAQGGGAAELNGLQHAALDTGY
jgi:hypothetical protein